MKYIYLYHTPGGDFAQLRLLERRAGEIAQMNVAMYNTSRVFAETWPSGRRRALGERLSRMLLEFESLRLRQFYKKQSGPIFFVGPLLLVPVFPNRLRWRLPHLVRRFSGEKLRFVEYPH